MSDVKLVQNILLQIECAANRVERRFEAIESVNSFLDSEEGLSDFLRLVEMAKLAQSMIAAEHFAPNEQGFYCGGCPHQEACRTWHVERSRTVVPVAA